MSPLRFLLGRILRGSTSLFHQSRNLAYHVPRLPMGVASAGTLCAALAGGMLYFKEDPGEPAAACEPSDDDEDAAIRRRFEEWMIKYGRRYKNKEEKAMRYQAFKRTIMRLSALPPRTDPEGATFGTNDLSDLTEEEWHKRSRGAIGLTKEQLLSHGITVDDKD